ncbi:uncharacterized protein LOC112268687 [Brachypodium distachyon]|uniref:uncharacterized protein LOC112268687 n=1 Tax=Brachypodium distachyon TaxID=15368 RepID=UPI000D0DF276|nr:uncharacterized protein LOC112268687 [Brachypodium distachyon]|eukprot:XP_024310402.1 uncharacterized protein LOC112268687 [Brachypodium distachyon]
MGAVLHTVPRKVTDAMNADLSALFTAIEVKEALFQMFPTKAPGSNGFPAHFFQRNWELCGAEVTAAILRILMGEDDPEEQSAFVPGQLITDNIITTYECLHFMKRNTAIKHRQCALKLDMQKAYDRVEWSYLQAIMTKIGFSDGWTALIMRMVSTVSFSVLFNGSPLPPFKLMRGIRQGDPISPYLILLAAEGLSCLLKSRSSVESSSLQGLMVASSALAVNHLLFADDSLLFVKTSLEGAAEAATVLDTYCQASGQRINLDKCSVFFSKGCPEAVRTEMKNTLQVHSESLSEKYLRMPSDVGHSTNGAFKYLKDRVWKRWGSREGKRKTCWVSWEDMCSPKFAGGLGFRDIELFNLSMLAKQAWRLMQSLDTRSGKTLKAVYFPQDDILTASLGAHLSQIWQAIIDGRDVLKQGLIRRIGNGESTHAWNDNWIPRDSLMRPIACPTDDAPCAVSDFIDSTSASWNRGKLEEFFLPMDVEIIQSIPICTRSADDFWAWNFEKTGVFSVRSAYRMLVSTKRRREVWLDDRASISNQSATERSWTAQWKVRVPSKLRVFLWRLAHTSLPTGDVRHHRGMAMSSCCGICGERDSWRHSLIECTVSRCV